MERRATGRKPSLVSQQPTTQSERTFSFSSPLPSEPEEKAEPDVPSRQPTRRKTSIAPPVERDASPVYSTSPEPEVVRQMSIRKSMRAPLRRLTEKLSEREPTPPYETDETEEPV